MDRALTDLIRISNVTGRDSSLVSGGGGNTSVKTDDGRFIYIKASGTALKDMDEKRGWRRLRLEPILFLIRDKRLAKLDVSVRESEVVDRLLLACDDNIRSGARPSVESHLHACLDKYVIHLHPLVLAAYVSAKKGRVRLDRLFKNEKPPPLWVPYTDPGFMLARKIGSLVEKYQKQYSQKPAIMFLEKHGLFVTAGTADAALRLVRKVIKICSSTLKPFKTTKRRHPNQQEINKISEAIHRAVHDATDRDVPVRYIKPDKTIKVFLQRKDAKKLLATPALNPDELVYANGSAMWLDNWDSKGISHKLKSLIKRGQKPAAAFIIKGIGLFVAANENISPVIAEITTGSLFVRMHTQKFGGINPLNRRQQDFINNWEAEAFRKQQVS